MSGEQPTDDSIEEIIEIEQDYKSQKREARCITLREVSAETSIASLTIDLNFGVLGQSPEEEFKF